MKKETIMFSIILFKQALLKFYFQNLKEFGISVMYEKIKMKRQYCPYMNNYGYF